MTVEKWPLPDLSAHRDGDWDQAEVDAAIENFRKAKAELDEYVRTHARPVAAQQQTCRACGMWTAKEVCPACGAKLL